MASEVAARLLKKGSNASATGSTSNAVAVADPPAKKRGSVWDFLGLGLLVAVVGFLVILMMRQRKTEAKTKILEQEIEMQTMAAEELKESVVEELQKLRARTNAISRAARASAAAVSSPQQTLGSDPIDSLASEFVKISVADGAGFAMPSTEAFFMFQPAAQREPVSSSRISEVIDDAEDSVAEDEPEDDDEAEGDAAESKNVPVIPANGK